MPEGITFNFLDYLELLDWTGRQIREGKKGRIDEHSLSILARFSMSKKHWLYLSTNFESDFKGLVGSVHALESAIEILGRSRLQGKGRNRLAFG